MKLKKEFNLYSNVMLERDKKQLLKTVSFKFSIYITNLLMNLGYNKRVFKKDQNKIINIGSGNLSFENVSNTDLFPSIGQILKRQIKRNSNSANKYYLNLIKKEKVFENQWEGIILSHVIEHIPVYLVNDCLKNMRSYLKKGGTIRILVPDSKKYFGNLNEGLESSQGFINSQLSLNRLFYSWEHKFMYSDKILIEILESNGFNNIKVCSFAEGDLSEYDAKEREFESLCITAEK